MHPKGVRAFLVRKEYFIYTHLNQILKNSLSENEQEYILRVAFGILILFVCPR